MTLAGIFFTAMGALVFQIVLTRVFSIIMWHHHAYLVVSVALLGFGGSGSFLVLRRPGLSYGKAGMEKLFFHALLFAIFTCISYLAVTRIPVQAMNLLGDWTSFLGFLAILALLAIPFFFAGMVIGRCFQLFPKKAGALYGVDLLGAGLGAFITPVMLAVVGTNGVAMVAAALAGAGALCFSIGKSWQRPVALGALTIFVAVATGFGTNTLFWEIPLDLSKQNMSSTYAADPRITKVHSLKIPFTGGKNIVWNRTVPDMTNHEIRHSATAQLDIWPEQTMPMLAGGGGWPD